MGMGIDSLVVVSSNQLSCDVDTETTVLDTRHGMYFGLNEMASFIWKSIQQPTTLAQVRDAILREYEVSESQCESDLLQIISKLTQEGLVTVLHE